MSKKSLDIAKAYAYKQGKKAAEQWACFRFKEANKPKNPFEDQELIDEWVKGFDEVVVIKQGT